MPKIFNSKIKSLLYLLLQNRYSWSILSITEKESIHQSNWQHNNFRDDYVNPELYGAARILGGENWNSQDARESTIKGKFIFDALESYNPISVLEIGPGSGYYTRSIFEFESVKNLDVVDINKSFIEYLNERVSSISHGSKEFNAYLGSIFDAHLQDNYYDMIILNSTIHHIPERSKLFNFLEKKLRVDGVILAYDPCHYLIRILQLISKIPEFLSIKFQSNNCNFSTHHFCTLQEYKIITNIIHKLKISSYIFIYPKKLKFVKNLPVFKHFKHYFATEMAIIFKRN